MLKICVCSAVALVCLMNTGCYYDRDELLPGLMIGEDGRLLKADPEHKRQVQEQVLNTELNRLCADGWLLRSIVLDQPRYEPKTYPEHPWRWDELSLRIQLIERKDPSAAGAAPTEAAILQVCQNLFTPTGATVTISVESSKLGQDSFDRMRAAVLSAQ